MRGRIARTVPSGIDGLGVQFPIKKEVRIVGLEILVQNLEGFPYLVTVSQSLFTFFKSLDKYANDRSNIFLLTTDAISGFISIYVLYASVGLASV